MTIFFTVLSGVLIFVFGQTILKLLIEPVYEMKKVIGDTAYTLLQNSNAYGNAEVITDPERLTAVRNELRSLGSNLLKSISTIPFYKTTRKWFLLPSEEEVEEAISCLIALSNSLVVGNPMHISSREKKVFESLKIYLYKDWKTEIIAKD